MNLSPDEQEALNRLIEQETNRLTGLEAEYERCKSQLETFRVKAKLSQLDGAEKLVMDQLPLFLANQAETIATLRLYLDRLRRAGT